MIDQPERSQPTPLRSQPTPLRHPVRPPCHPERSEGSHADGHHTAAQHEVLRSAQDDDDSEAQDDNEGEADAAGAQADTNSAQDHRRRHDHETVDGDHHDVTSPLIGTPRGIIPRPKDQPVVFAHPSEREFARILDFYRIVWEYEPRSFVLRAKGEQVLEMFSPDFYLSDMDLYIELTTLRQRLVTKKNRKLRVLRELYPDIVITLLYKHDYQELLAKYGYGPADLDPPLADALRSEAEHILFSQSQIAAAVRRLGDALTRDYAGRAPILIGVLKGVTFFLADLMRAIQLPVAVDFMAVSQFSGPHALAVAGRATSAHDSGAVRIIKDLDLDIRGRDVILVEDIVDTGMTLRYILGHLAARAPASLEVCTLLDKRARRLVNVPIRYTAFELRDEFAVGYGLDYRQRYRNLPFLAKLRPELYRPDSFV